MSLRMLTVLLFVAAISFAPLCAAGWYSAKIVVAVFSAAGSLYCGARDRCDCVREEIAVLRNASLAQCAWVQATVLREKAAEALVASGMWQWLKLCEWFPDIWTLLALALSLFIARAVQGIVANLHNTTAGLSRLRTAYCVWGKYPELLTSACRSYRERKGSGFVTDDEHDLCLPYVVLHMSFAGWPLSNTTLESPLQLWSVVQQVALTLAVAEEALEFEHRAPSEDHVLVKKAHHDVLSFRLNGRVLHVNTFGVHAFLVDFCASRLRPLGDVEPLFTDLKKMPRRKRDAMGETFAKICSLVGEEPWQYCPKTNVACLEGLTRSLVRRFESRFAAAVDEAEQEAWCDMCFWLDEMPYCASATELALQMVM